MSLPLTLSQRRCNGYHAPMTIRDRAQNARQAGRRLPAVSASLRSMALHAVSKALKQHASDIFTANLTDMERSKQEGLATPLLKRLKFDEDKLTRVCEGIEALAKMPDPVAKVLEKRELDEGLIINRVSAPIGVIGMIFESRPDALVQMATLCMRSSNAVILKGGSEALETNRILAKIIATASTEAGLPEGWIQLAETRQDVAEMLTMDQEIDLLIPRGSNEFVARIMRESSIPVLGHADGICHIFLDEDADLAMAIPIILDAKLQYPAACNAVETLLVHERSAQRLRPSLVSALQEQNCVVRGCAASQKVTTMERDTDADWDTEYLDAEISIKIVRDLDEAMSHIHRHGSGHTEAIITNNQETADALLSQIDAADVFHNCSTRFADG
ncbi:MAG: glutamate-5-semialdehyde dehydrogenase, partial [Spirochaetales bacterium]|nr:glutamate-5-semialdehyde dehydrogenase [Spirochaetales bacterium]